MACGVHLGILLILLVQAEHVCCLWATQAQSSYKPNSNTYVGFSQQSSGYGGISPQNQLRPASTSLGLAQSSSLNTQTAVSSGYSQGLSSSGSTQTVSQPAKSGYGSVRLVHSSSVSKPNWQTTKLNEVNVQKMPNKQFLGLSTAIASGSSVSQYNKNQSSKKKTSPVQQVPHTSNYLSSSYASIQSPSRESYSAQSAAQRTSPAEAYMSSSIFSAGAPAPQRSPARTKTSASAPARRVTPGRGSAASKPYSFSSLQNERSRNYPSQTGAGKPYQSSMFAGNAAYAQEGYKPTSNMDSRHVSNSQSSQRLSYSSSEQTPSSTNSLQTSWNSRYPAQGAHNLPASGSSRVGTSGQHFAPTRVHNIPQRFGGFAIRRLKDSDGQKEVGVGKPQKSFVAPQQQATRQTYVAQQQWQQPTQTYVSQRQPPLTYVAPKQPQATQQTSSVPQQQPASAHPKSKWKRIRFTPNLEQ